MDCDDILRKSIGPKVASFYLSLRGGGSDINIHDILAALMPLESHEPVQSLGETEDIIEEIVADCQKKSAQILRIPYADSVRTLIASCRKKLAAKVALDADSSNQHSQRHINTLLELLGTWSNMIAEIDSWGTSTQTLRLIVAPLHARIIEMAFDCFERFKEDKNLENWHIRVMEAAASATALNGAATPMSSSTGGSSAGASISIVALDFLLTQMAALRDIIHQYYEFIKRVVGERLVIRAENRLHTLRGETNGDVTDAIIAAEAALTPSALGNAVAREIDLLCSAEERNRWRELDAVYAALEFGYLTQAVNDALTEGSLLEAEITDGMASKMDGGCVLVPQAVEDVFFLMRRVAERAASTGSESSAFAVGNKIVELLDPSQDHDLDMGMGMGPGSSSSTLTLHRLLTCRAVFRGAAKSKVINPAAAIATLASRRGGKAPWTPGGAGGVAYKNANSSGRDSGSALNELLSSPGLTLSTENSGNYSASVAAAVGADLAVSATALAEVALSGVNSWLMGLTTPSPAASKKAQGPSGPSAILPPSSNGAGNDARAPIPPAPVSSSSSASNGIAAAAAADEGGASTKSDGTGIGISNSTNSGSVSGPGNMSRPPLPSGVGVNGGYAAAASSGTMAGTVECSTPVAPRRTTAAPAATPSAAFTAGSSTKSSGNLVDDLLSALESDAAGDPVPGSGSAWISSSEDSRPLSLEDAAIQLSAIAVAPSSSKSLALFFDMSAGVGCDDNSTGAGGSGSGASTRSKTLSLVANELFRCASAYSRLLGTEAYAYAHRVYVAEVLPAVDEMFSRSYDINGETMERRTGTCELLFVLSKVLPLPPSLIPESQLNAPKNRSGKGKGGNGATPLSAPRSGGDGDDFWGFERDADSNSCRDKEKETMGSFLRCRMSIIARTEVVLQLAKILSAAVMDAVMRTQFSEWGALLLQQEVLSILRMFDDALEDSFADVIAAAGGGAVSSSSNAVFRGNGGSSSSSSRSPSGPREAFDSLTWALKILTLDQPADIRRYNIPEAAMNEDTTRLVLARRKDFSRDAVAKVKITILPATATGAASTNGTANTNYGAGNK